MYYTIASWGTPAYDLSVHLRYKVLRQPLGLEFSTYELAEEYKQFHLLCYSDASRLVGCLVLKPIDKETIKMRQVAVVKNMQKKGIGTFMVYHAEKSAQSMDYKKMILHARTEAIPFYEKLKYKKVGRSFLEIGIKHYQMMKEL